MQSGSPERLGCLEGVWDNENTIHMTLVSLLIPPPPIPPLIFIARSHELRSLAVVVSPVVQ